MKKLRPIKWKFLVEGSDFKDNYFEYCMSVMQPNQFWTPCNPKYRRQRSRFIKK